jgi:hypothetical protein
MTAAATLVANLAVNLAADDDEADALPPSCQVLLQPPWMGAIAAMICCPPPSEPTQQGAMM